MVECSRGESNVDMTEQESDRLPQALACKLDRHHRRNHASGACGSGVCRYRFRQVFQVICMVETSKIRTRTVMRTLLMV